MDIDLNSMARQPLFGAARMESRILGRVGMGRVLVLDLHEIVDTHIICLCIPLFNIAFFFFTQTP